MTKLADDSRPLRLAMLGMVDGNGHPYSWSAIFNGCDREEMKKCPYSNIPAYLFKERLEQMRIPGARVTHIWTDRPEDAEHVAKASLIPHVVNRAEDVIGQVDAVLIATDIGHEHVRRCRPFVEAGIPVFVDKPLADNSDDLRTFTRWVDEGKPIFSSSCMRYAKEFMPFRASTRNMGDIRFASITMAKSWERYGIHALESIYPIFGPGFESVRNLGTADRNIVHLRHDCGADVIAVTVSDLYGSFGVLQLCGTAGHATVSFEDTYYAFRAQLEAFVGYLRTGERPFPFAETEELIRLVVAGIRSREEGGREVLLTELA